MNEDIFDTEAGVKLQAATEEEAREALTRRKRHYGHTFLGPAGQETLSDLATFCRGHESCWHPDPRIHAVAEGRREVWLRIEHHLNLSVEQLYVLYNGGRFLPRQDQSPPLNEGHANG